MVTLTMRHTRADRLPSLWAALSAAWGRVTSGKAWQAEKAAHGLAGWLRVVETTHGANGWHLHVHALMFVRDAPDAVQLAAWKNSMFARWSRALDRAGMRPALIAAQDVHLVESGETALSHYFTKVADHGRAVALEFTHSAGKQSRSAVGGRTPWAILDGVIGSGDADDLDLWHEWESASKGRRQITWSRGLRDLLGLDDESSDEEIAEEELGDRTDDVIRIPAAAWKLMCRDLALAPLALDTLEHAGIEATVALLRAAGLECTPVDRPGSG